jgi:hypothetical protein
MLVAGLVGFRKYFGGRPKRRAVSALRRVGPTHAHLPSTAAAIDHIAIVKVELSAGLGLVAGSARIAFVQAAWRNKAWRLIAETAVVVLQRRWRLRIRNAP